MMRPAFHLSTLIAPVKFSLGAMALATLAACQSAPVERAPLKAVPASCSGRAPSGELTAVRIAGANTTRTEAGLYEGPVWIKGALYYSDFTFGAGFPSRIQRLDQNGTVTTFAADSGSNGLAVDASGNIIAGTHKTKGLSRFDLATGQRTAVLDKYKGNVFNSPNDLTIAADGTIYFTDPAFQKAAAPGGQDTTNVYRVGKDGVVSVVDQTISNPNGVALSPAGDMLYANGGGDKGVLRAYPIVNGVPQQGRDIVTGLMVPDGMALDCLGNIYVTEHVARRIRVFSPAGAQLATIKVDANVTNVAFGGADGKTLYISGAGAIWQVPLEVAGTPY